MKKPGVYGPRRKLWNQALSIAALKDYEQNIINCIHELIQAMELRKSTPVDITDWMELFGYVYSSSN
jgi:cytochrome P450